MDATKTIVRNLGGDRLGSGAKNNISLHNYNRSSHDLSRAWRSSMTVGTLVPFLHEVVLPGDTWSINLQTLVRTIPSIGPLYGSFKLQLDVFECPIRLYNGLLHNNMTKIGLNMAQVKLPKVMMSHTVVNPKINAYEKDNSQISSNSLMNYLGLRGIADVKFKSSGAANSYVVERKINAVPLLAYWEIYKCYYANKQEEKGVVIEPTFEYELGEMLTINGSDDSKFYFQSLKDSLNTTSVSFTGSSFQWLRNKSGYASNPVQLMEGKLYDNVVYNMTFKKIMNLQAIEFLLYKYDTQAYSKVGISTMFPNWRTENNQIILGNPVAGYTFTSKYILQGVAYNATKVKTSEGITLRTFDLSNIDDARIAILQDTGLNNELLTNNLGLPYSEVSDLDGGGESYSSYPMAGLGIKTYQSDLLNNWLQTEWIDGSNGINAITAIDTSSGSFQIDALNLANKVYNMLNRIAVSGGSYEDYIEAVYTVEANRRAESPIYRGGLSAEIAFEEVVSTAETADNPIGTLAGKGGQHNVKGGHIEIRTDEPSYIIGIVSITPRLDYSQGNSWDLTELDNMGDLHRPQLDGIGFEDLLEERAAWFGTYIDEADNSMVKLAIGKVPAWINYMTALNETHGDFAEENKCMYMTLNRRYENNIGNDHVRWKMGIYDLTTYINPAKFNYAFADSSLTSQNFWVQIGMDITARRVMSAKVIPSL